jgi:hypothetical protein
VAKLAVVRICGWPTVLTFAVVSWAPRSGVFHSMGKLNTMLGVSQATAANARNPPASPGTLP